MKRFWKYCVTFVEPLDPSMKQQSRILRSASASHDSTAPQAAEDRASTGVEGLNHVLGGGLMRGHVYLIQGKPGVGKTTLGLQFLLAGVKQGEKVLYVTLSETKAELITVADSHGWSLKKMEIHELAAEDQLKQEGHYTLFHPAEVELSETTRDLLTVVDRVQPTRVVFDSLSEIRLLAGDAFRYRRQILSLKHYFAGRQCTVLLLEDESATPADLQLQSLVHGVIGLEQFAPIFGTDRRRLRVAKMRGMSYRSGYHDFVIQRGGLTVHPRLVAAEHRRRYEPDLISTGSAQLDQLMGGGLDRGGSVLLLGPAGVGKSTVALLCAITSALRGERVEIFCFEESINMLFSRMKGLDLDVATYVEDGTISIQQIDPAEMSPGAFVSVVRQAVRDGARMVLIDSLNGYVHSMAEERDLILQLHELLAYLGQQQVTVLLIVGQQGLVSASMIGHLDISYLADTVLLCRYFEFRGELRQALSVFKRRGGKHERTIRELKLIDGQGVLIGEPLKDFRGVLTGVPEFSGLKE